MTTLEQKQTNSLMLKTSLILGVIFTIIAYLFWQFTVDTGVCKYFVMMICSIPAFIIYGKKAAGISPLVDYTYIQALISVIGISYFAATFATITYWLPISFIDHLCFEAQAIVPNENVVAGSDTITNMITKVITETWNAFNNSLFGQFLAEIVRIASQCIFIGVVTSLFTRKKVQNYNDIY